MKINMPFLMAALLSVATPVWATPKTFIDYFLPTPIVGSLTTNVWGAATVGPRDPKNGLEDAALNRWNYWDGKIIKGPEGKYHLFASRWAQSRGHNDWWNSRVIHAVSDNLIGPYKDEAFAGRTTRAARGTTSPRSSCPTAAMPSSSARRDRARSLFPNHWMARGKNWA